MRRSNLGDGARAATLADVGRAAGVSKMAASLVLNSAGAGSRVSPETRERIIEAAKALRYRPNVAAQALTNGRINTLGLAAVLADGKPDSAFLEIFGGLLAAAARCGQNTTIFNLRDWDDGLARLGGFFDGRIDGLILIAPAWGSGKLPVVPRSSPLVTVQANRPLPGAVNIESDEEAGAYALTRQGNAPDLPMRPVQVLELRVLELAPPVLRCELHVSKGYYVRSLARDLGERLGAPAHLSALRRLASGPFTLENASPWPAAEPPPLLGLTEAATSVLPACRLRDEGAVLRARQGKLLLPEDFTELPDVAGPGAWLTPGGELVALGTTTGELKVVRGFNSER